MLFRSRMRYGDRNTWLHEICRKQGGNSERLTKIYDSAEADRSIWPGDLCFPCSSAIDKVSPVDFLYGILFSMRTRVDYLADKYGFTELNESPVFAGSGRMFWRGVGRQMSGQKKAAYCFWFSFAFWCDYNSFAALYILLLTVAIALHVNWINWWGRIHQWFSKQRLQDVANNHIRSFFLCYKRCHYNLITEPAPLQLN